MKLSLKEILKESWKQTKLNYKFLIPLFLLVLALSFALNLEVDDMFSLYGIVSLLISPIIYFVITNSSLKISRGQKVGFKDLFSGFTQKTYTSFLTIGIVVSLATVVLLGVTLSLMSFNYIIGGLLSLVIIIFLTIYFLGVIFFPYYRLLDKGGSFWIAIKDSVKISKGNRLFLIKFIIVTFLINLLGIIAFGVGLLFTLPLSSIALSHVYDKLKVKN